MFSSFVLIFFSIPLDHLCELRDVVPDHVVEPLVFFRESSILLFESCVLFKNVINGQEAESIFSASSYVPENVGLSLPVLLLKRVICVESGRSCSLRPRVGEDTGEGEVEIEFLLQLRISLATEPSFVVAPLGIVWIALSVVNGALVVRP